MNDRDRQWAELVLRVFLGLIFTTAGAYKLFAMGLGGWVGFLSGQFEAVPLPAFLVTLFGYLVPFLELGGGLLLLLGLFRRFAFVLTGLTCAALAFGKFIQGYAAAVAGESEAATNAFFTAAHNGVYVLAAVVGLLVMAAPFLAMDSFREG